MPVIRVLTYNLDHFNPFAYGGKSYQYPGTDVDRFALAAKAIRMLDPDVLLVQELFGRSQEEVKNTAQSLAFATGLQCQHDGKVTAHKSAYHDLGTGILWNSRVTPLGWRLAETFWHPMSVLNLQVGDHIVNHMVYHAQPVGRLQSAGTDSRPSEAVQVAKLASINALTIVGGDWNSLSAARMSSGDYWDPEPQIDTTMSEQETAYILNRTPGIILEANGLTDVAAARGNIQCTIGHRRTRKGRQRLDRFYATSQMLPFIRSIQAVVTPETEIASDHLPVLLTYELD